MTKFKAIFRILIGILIGVLSIGFIAISFDSGLLAGLGVIGVPILLIYLNKKFNIKAKTYYLGLIGFFIFSIIITTIFFEGDKKEVAVNDSKPIISENKKEEEDKKELKEAKTNEEDLKGKEVASKTEEKKSSTAANDNIFDGYTLIEVDGGNLSGHREPNVVVDIGFGDREYYAFTNEYGQLVKVMAKEIILQDDSTEPVKSNGRYYNDEAKVPGVESPDLDEGHVISDSLGGVSNAYNITPQNSTLNRHGDQAYMEKVIRDAGGAKDFVAIITYPNTTTQVPSHYSYTYTINGNVINDEFDNINPDEYNASNNTGSGSSSGAATNNTPATPTPAPVATPEPTPAPPVVSEPNATDIVYWTPNGKSYHTTENCSTLSRSKIILSGTIAESGKFDPCDRCH